MLCFKKDSVTNYLKLTDKDKRMLKHANEIIENIIKLYSAKLINIENEYFIVEHIFSKQLIKILTKLINFSDLKIISCIIVLENDFLINGAVNNDILVEFPFYKFDKYFEQIEKNTKPIDIKFCKYALKEINQNVKLNEIDAIELFENSLQFCDEQKHYHKLGKYNTKCKLCKILSLNEFLKIFGKVFVLFKNKPKCIGIFVREILIYDLSNEKDKIKLFKQFKRNVYISFKLTCITITTKIKLESIINLLNQPKYYKYINYYDDYIVDRYDPNLSKNILNLNMYFYLVKNVDTSFDAENYFKQYFNDYKEFIKWLSSIVQNPQIINDKILCLYNREIFDKNGKYIKSIDFRFFNFLMHGKFDAYNSLEYLKTTYSIKYSGKTRIKINDILHIIINCDKIIIEKAVNSLSSKINLIIISPYKIMNEKYINVEFNNIEKYSNENIFDTLKYYLLNYSSN